MLMGLFLIYNGVSKKHIRSFILLLRILIDCKYWVEKSSVSQLQTGGQDSSWCNEPCSVDSKGFALLWEWSDADLPEGLSRCWLVFSAYCLSVLAGMMCHARCVWGEHICAVPHSDYSVVPSGKEKVVKGCSLGQQSGCSSIDGMMLGFTSTEW